MGQIEINHTGSGGGVVLSSDGTNLLLGGSAVGGGGASASDDLYIANPSSATNPTAAGTNAVSIGSGSVASGEKGFALLGGTASGQYAMAFNNYAVASAEKSISLGWLTDATATSAVAIGTGTQSSGSHSVALGQSNARGVDSFAAAIGNASASYGTGGEDNIAIGYLATTSSGNAVAIGSRTTAGIASIAIGHSYGNYGCVSSGGGSVVIGDGSAATASLSMAFGYGAKSAIKGKFAYSSKAFGDANATGTAQGGMFILMSDTTNATAEAMTTNNATADATNQIVAASDTCIMFSGTVVAMQNGAADQGGWEIKGLLKNDGGTTTLVNSQVNSFDTGNGWDISLYADDTNNALKVQCTGEASHNIRWVANIQTSEVTYA